MPNDKRLDALIAEAVGTFALVFAATGSIMVNDLSGGVVTHIGIAAAPGLVVAAMIYAVGDISAAHFNPAVTIGFWSVGRLPARLVAPYLLSQTAGAVLASLALWLLLPADRGLMGAHVPALPAGAAVAMEVILTFFLMFVILGGGSHQPAALLRLGGRRGGGARHLVCRPHQRRFDEPGAFAGPGAVCRRTAALSVDLPRRTGRRRTARRGRRPPHQERQPLPNLTRIQRVPALRPHGCHHPLDAV